MPLERPQGFFRRRQHVHVLQRRARVQQGLPRAGLLPREGRRSRPRAPVVGGVAGERPAPGRHHRAASASTAKTDRVAKRRCTANGSRIPEYFLYDPTKQGRVRGGGLSRRGIRHDPWKWIPTAASGATNSNCTLGPWDGVFESRYNRWPRFFDADGNLIPTFSEAEATRADKAERQAAAAAQQVDGALQHAAESAQRAAEALHMRPRPKNGSKRKNRARRKPKNALARRLPPAPRLRPTTSGSGRNSTPSAGNSPRPRSDPLSHRDLIVRFLLIALILAPVPAFGRRNCASTRRRTRHRPERVSRLLVVVDERGGRAVADRTAGGRVHLRPTRPSRRSTADGSVPRRRRRRGDRHGDGRRPGRDRHGPRRTKAKDGGRAGASATTSCRR